MYKLLLPGVYTASAGLTLIFKFPLTYYLFTLMTWPIGRVFDILFPSSSGSVSGNNEGVIHTEYYITTIFSSQRIPLPFEQFPLVMIIVLSVGLWYWVGGQVDKLFKFKGTPTN